MAYIPKDGDFVTLNQSVREEWSNQQRDSPYGVIERIVDNRVYVRWTHQKRAYQWYWFDSIEPYIVDGMMSDEQFKQYVKGG
jgi:hypothetical protein